MTTCRSWLVSFRMSSQWARCSTFKYSASACCSSCSSIQKPSTFPSSTCIDLLRQWSQTQFLEGHSSAEFSSNPNQSHLIQLIKVFRITRNFQAAVIWSWLELNSAELWPSRNWVWDHCAKGWFHICYMCSSSISYMLTAVCCGCIGSSSVADLFRQDQSHKHCHVC